ncbi:hypothetical protein D5085_01040 [Ectothiorhodospiraceae bacterium BW-2]|nr:hypothetical protein D5085_01040 [Ectothiorhodospiraceae bacterium BW-2]
MQAIEIKTEITEAHQIHLQLPDTIRSGPARVVILLDNPPETDARESAEQNFIAAQQTVMTHIWDNQEDEVWNAL